MSVTVYSASERQFSRKGCASNVLLELLLEALVDAVAKVLDRVLAALQDDRCLIVRQLAARLGVTVFRRAARQQWPLPTSARTTRAVKWPVARLVHAHEVQVLPRHVQQFIKIPFVMRRDRARVRHALQQIQFL